MAKGFNRLPVFAGVLLLAVLLAACSSNVPGTSGPIDIRHARVHPGGNTGGHALHH